MSDRKEPSKYINDIDFYKFTNTNLPKFGFYITDVDAVVRTNKNQILIIETKCRMAEPSIAQLNSYKAIHSAFINSDKKSLWMHQGKVNDWAYYGLHLIQYENTSFEDGKAYFDRKEVTKAELVNIFNFKSDRLKIYARGRDSKH